MAFINSIGTSNPGHKKAQQSIAEFMAKAHRVENNERGRLLALYRATGIKYRYSVIDDYTSADDYNFYPSNETMEPFPSTSKRMELFREQALKLSLLSTKKCLTEISVNPSEITDLVTVSCTGMYAPGLRDGP